MESLNKDNNSLNPEEKIDLKYTGQVITCPVLFLIVTYYR